MPALDGPNTAALVNLLITNLSKMAQWGALIAKARAEGRDVSEDDLDDLFEDDDDARDELQAAIEARR